MKKYYIKDIQKFKDEKKKFATITAYDYLSAKLVEELDFPLILVGDSASMVVYGYDDTTPISMEEMLLILRAVVRGAKLPIIVADMPFMSYQPSIEEAIKNSGKFIKNGANAVKFQAYKADTLVSKNSPAYWDTNLEPTKTQYELFKKHDSFNEADFEFLSKFCKIQDIEFICTPFDLNSVEYLNRILPP